ncbi:hypothetical protein HanPSC8_Chr04g0155181 [Helianthus annuus]|nr:hypothetical protein HanIR_Chr04g0174091 [Helianthus annuus]KAJ0930917.1 hypothetical protein HanPSC8_Chr04g0155181 [Helianthus annuus]
MSRGFGKWLRLYLTPSRTLFVSRSFRHLECRCRMRMTFCSNTCLEAVSPRSMLSFRLPGLHLMSRSQMHWRRYGSQLL